MFIDVISATARMSLPILFAGSGGYFSEKSGVPQIGLEAYLLTGAFSAAAVTSLSESLFLGYLSAMFFGFLMAQIFCLMVLKFKANAIVAGTAMNLFAMGIIPLVSKSLFDSTGSTPTLTESPWMLQSAVVATGVMFTVCFYLSEISLWGLQIKFAGEKSEALQSVGVDPLFRRWQAVSFAAVVTAVGGCLLSTYLASSYSPLMSAGRGFIALAAVIFSGWNLKKTWIVVLFFGLAEALQIQIQNLDLGFKIPTEFIQMLPYILTIFVLVSFKNKQIAPKELA